MRPLITNGGAHPADKWAEVTVDTILDLIEVKEDSVSPEAAEARKVKRELRPRLFDIFDTHHEGVQAGERAKAPKSVKEATANLDKPLELHPDVPATLAEVNAVLKATPFAAHFAQEHVQQVLTQIIGQHTADVMHIERRYHLDLLTQKEA